MKGIHFIATVVFFLVSFGSSKGALIPFYEGLTFNTEEIYSKLEGAYLMGSPDACTYAKELVELTDNSDFDLKYWSRLTYMFLLLENDSISKAEKFLADSSFVEGQSVRVWLRTFFRLNQSLVYSYQGNYLKANTLLRKTIKNAGAEYQELNVRMNALLADNLRYQGKLDQSLVKWYETLKMSESLNDSALIADSYVGLGTVRFLQQKLEEAQDDIEIFFGYNSRIGNMKGVAYAWSLLGLIEYEKGNYQLSIDYNLTGYELRKTVHDLKGQGESLNNLALGYMGLQNWIQSLQYLQEAMEVKVHAGDLSQTTDVLNNIAYCYSRMGNKTESLKYFQQALEKGIQNGQIREAIRSYENIIRIYRNDKDFQSAFDLQSDLLAVKDSLNVAERNEAINELEVLYETEAKEQEIQMLQQERTIITNRWLTLAMGLFLAIILGILFIDNQKRKYRNDTQLLVTQDELRKSELKNMADQLDYNQKKLALYTENLIKKNELVGQLEERLKESVEIVATEPEQGRKIVADFSSVRILTDDDWNEFKELFDEVHHGLLERLLEVYKDLTLADQRLFLLMRLDLSTAQIANILGVSPDSVKKGRYRLKKKLALTNETSLQGFVTSF